MKYEILSEPKYSTSVVAQAFIQFAEDQDIIPASGNFLREAVIMHFTDKDAERLDRLNEAFSGILHDEPSYNLELSNG